MADHIRDWLTRVASEAAYSGQNFLRGNAEEVLRRLDEADKTKADYATFVNNMLAADKRRDELTDERHAIGVTPEAAAWVIGKVVEAIDVGPSFRAFIYGLMGFGPESYSMLYLAGGMAFTNAITEAGVDASVSARRSDRRARRWEAFGRRIWHELVTTRIARDMCNTAWDQEYALRRQTEAERDTARRELAESRREADRLRHGEAIESDYICPDSLALTEARRELGEVRALVEEHRKRRAASLFGQWSTYGDGACDALDELSAAIDDALKGTDHG